MLLWWLLPIALVIVAFYLFRQRDRAGARRTRSTSSRSVTRGEIGKDEFEQKDAISAVK